MHEHERSAVCLAVYTALRSAAARTFCAGNTGQTTAFINTTANFIKSIDPYHLVRLLLPGASSSDV